MSERWSYHIEEIRLSDKWSAKAQAEELERFRRRFGVLGGRGWELVSYQAVPITGSINTTSINAWVYMAIFKRAEEGPLDSVSVDGEENWHPDPWGRHEQRYWNGMQWTRHVISAGEQSEDDPL